MISILKTNSKKIIKVVIILFLLDLLLAKITYAQSTTMPTSPGGTNRVGFDSSSGEYFFMFNTDTLYWYKPANDTIWDGTGGTLSAIRAHTYDGKNEFRPSWTGGPRVEFSGGEKCPTDAGVTFSQLQPPLWYIDGTVITQWCMKFQSDSFSYQYELHISGRTLVIHVEALNGSSMATGFIFDRCENASNPRIVPVPYLTLFNLMRCDTSYTSLFFDWEVTNCSRYTPLTPEVLSGNPSTSARFGPVVAYAKKTDGVRNPLNETIYLTVSPDLDGALPNISGPDAPLKSRLQDEIIISYQPPYPWILRPWNNDNTLPCYLDSLANMGITNVALIMKDWWWSGYDGGNPNVRPANDFNMGIYACSPKDNSGGGGDNTLKLVRDKAHQYGYLFALHQNYVDMYEKHRDSGIVDISVGPSYFSKLPYPDNKSAQSTDPNCKMEIPYAVKPSRVQEVAGILSGAIYNSYYADWSYLDVGSSTNPSGPLEGDPNRSYVDFDASIGDGAGKFLHTLSNYRMVPWAVRNNTGSRPTQGEGGNHFLYAGYFDDFEARIYTANPNCHGINSPLLVDFHLKKLHSKSSYHGVGHIYDFDCIPLDDIINEPDDEAKLLPFIATELAYGNGGLVTKNAADIQDHSLRQIALEYQHVLPVYRKIANLIPSEISYSGDGGMTWQNASQYIGDHEFWDNINSTDFMSQVKVIYPGGITVVVNRNPTRSLDPDISPDRSRWFAFHTQSSLGTGKVNSTFDFTLPPLNGWVVYDPTTNGDPDQPTLMLPANGAINIPKSVLLKWGVAPKATSYEVHIRKSSGNIDVPIPTTWYTLSNLSADEIVEWWVTAKNTGGYSPESPHWSFTTVLTAPTLVSPANRAINVQIVVPVKFSWNASSGATLYWLQVATDSLFTTGMACNDSTLTDTTKQVGIPAYGTQYFWRVRKKNAGGSTSAWSTTWSFTTVLLTQTLLSPTNGETDVPIPVTFIWNPLSGATTYRLQVSTDSSFTTGMAYNDSTLTGTTKQLSTLLNGTLYYWRVNAKNAGGLTSAWSTRWSFTTILPAPTLVSPADSATNISISPTLKWNKVIGAISYRIELSRNTAFDSAAIIKDSSGVTDTSIQITRLANGTTYYWRVNTTNIGVTSAWSTPWSFTTILPAPTLVSPANGATNVPVQVTFSWKASSGATSYWLQVSTDSSFTTGMACNDSTLTDTTKQLINLTSGTLYYWQVRAKNAGVSISAWSTKWSFTTILPTPTLVSPANVATNISIPVTFSWNASSGATSYWLQVSTDSSFTTVMACNDSTLTGTTKQLNTLANGTPYFWRVRAKNTGGLTSAWSTIWSFTTSLLAPTLVSPANGATNVPKSVTFNWNSSSGARSYRLQVWFAQGLIVNDTTTSTSYTVGELPNNKVISWKVNATYPAGTSGYSSVWSFTTIVAAPSPPTLISPANGATNVPLPVTFSWNASSGATSYWLQVSTSISFTSGMACDDSTLTGTTKQLSNLTNGTLYYWRVNAKNVGGKSGWSSTWSFTTIVAAPSPPPTLISPANGATNVPLPVTFSWNASSGATSYWLQVSTSISFTSGMACDDSTLTGTTKQLSNLTNGTLYYWRVNAKNVGGKSGWSSTWSFITILQPPTLVWPANGATNVPRSLRLRWNVSRGATSYWISVWVTNGMVVNTSSTDTSYYLTNLAANYTYYWHVNASNAVCTSAWSATWSFTTGTSMSKKSLTHRGSGSDDDEFSSAIPVEYALSQNYPNPFNPSTNIQLDLPKDGRVVLIVYDLLGRKVTTLLDDDIPAGSYVLLWDGKNDAGQMMATGIYFYRIIANDFVGTKKMIFMR